MYKAQVKSILSDIRFWLLVFFLLRLVGITNAPLEAGHNWRQSLTNMIARNFLEVRAHILYPMIDMAGEKSGIIGSEFPFLNYLIYLSASLFEYTHWHGRLINLLISTIGLYFFYKLIKSLFNKKTAFSATIVLTTSVWFAFSRKIMPDTFSVSLVIIGLYYAYRFLQHGYRLSLILFFVFTTLGILCKIPALSLFSLLIIPVFVKGIDTGRKIALYTAAGLSFALVCAWYFYWVPYLLETYRYELYAPKGIAEGVKEIAPLVPELLEKFYFSALHSYLAFVCCLAGLFMLMKSKHHYTKLGIGVVAAVFVVFIIKTGAIFPTHNYYIIPFTPVMALCAGYFLAQIPPKYQYLLLVLIGIEGIANQQHDFFIKESELYKLSLEEKTGRIIPKDDLILINGGPSPQDMYFAHKKGWTTENENLLDPHFLDSLAQLGAKYLVVDKTKLTHTFQQYKSAYADEYYAIYELENVADKKYIP